MRSDFNDVGDFQEKFNLPIASYNDPRPLPVSKAMLDLRIKRLQEEVDEFIEAAQAGDYGEMFDAMIDLVYIAHGTTHFFGFPWAEGWRLVHDANMTKERAARDGGNSKHNSQFDIVKPENWIAPDIHALIEGRGWPLRADVCCICHYGILDWREHYTINSTPNYKQYAHVSCAEEEGLL
jgi:predicted HAD superfamily Cof-like phosphohydrolase